MPARRTFQGKAVAATRPSKNLLPSTWSSVEKASLQPALYECPSCWLEVWAYRQPHGWTVVWRNSRENKIAEFQTANHRKLNFDAKVTATQQQPRFSWRKVTPSNQEHAEEFISESSVTYKLIRFGEPYEWLWHIEDANGGYVESSEERGEMTTSEAVMWANSVLSRYA